MNTDVHTLSGAYAIDALGSQARSMLQFVRRAGSLPRRRQRSRAERIADVSELG